MFFKAFLQADLITNLATFTEGELMSAAALLKGLELSGPYPDFVNSYTDDGQDLEMLIERDIDGHLGRVAGYGDEWVILFAYSPFHRNITIKGLARNSSDIDLEIFAGSDDLDEEDVLPLNIWLSSLSPVLQSQIESLHQSVTAPVKARRRLLKARHTSLAEAKSLFNFSQTGLLSFESRCDFLLDLLRKELGSDVALTISAQFPDGIRIESRNFTTLGKAIQDC